MSFLSWVKGISKVMPKVQVKRNNSRGIPYRGLLEFRSPTPQDFFGLDITHPHSDEGKMVRDIMKNINRGFYIKSVEPITSSYPNLTPENHRMVYFVIANDYFSYPAVIDSDKILRLVFGLEVVWRSVTWGGTANRYFYPPLRETSKASLEAEWGQTIHRTSFSFRGSEGLQGYMHIGVPYRIVFRETEFSNNELVAVVEGWYSELMDRHPILLLRLSNGSGTRLHSNHIVRYFPL